MADSGMALYLQKKHPPSPSVLILTVSNTKNRHYRNDRTDDRRSHQQKSRQPLPHMIGLHVNNLDIHDTSSSSFGWQRYSDKMSHLSPAPDIAYRNTYLEKKIQKKLDQNHQYRSITPRSKLNNNNSFSDLLSESSPPKQYTHQYRTIYDYIRASIRQIEQQRNSKQSNISTRIKRPQNEDSTYRRALGEKKLSAKTSFSGSSSTTTQTLSSLFNNDLKTPRSFVNYINYSRVYQTPTPNEQQQQQQQFFLSQNV